MLLFRWINVGGIGRENVFFRCENVAGNTAREQTITNAGFSGIKKPSYEGYKCLIWRRDRDSNPRYTFTAYTRLAGERLQPTRPSLRESACAVASIHCPIAKSGGVGFAGGGSRIRTHGPCRDNGFQDRLLQPLGHPSGSQHARILTPLLQGVKIFSFSRAEAGSFQHSPCCRKRPNPLQRHLPLPGRPDESSPH